MSNRYYSSGLPLGASTNVRSLQVNGQFKAVESGLDKVQTEVDSVTAEVVAARQGMTSLNANLSRFRYTHVQSTAAATWVVNHNIGNYPQVDVLGPGGSPMLAELVHTSQNQVTVYFDSPTTGRVLCFY